MRGFLSVRRFIYTKDGRLRINWYVIVAVGLFILAISYQLLHDRNRPAVSDKFSDPAADARLAEIQTEYAVATTNEVYLVLDFNQGRLMLKQHGALVWEAPFQIDATDTANVPDFIQSFTSGGRIHVRAIERTHLFKSHPVISDTVLTVVGEALNMPPERIKRYLPERYAVCWDARLCLDIRTDVVGRAHSLPSNIEESLRERIGDWLGGSTLTINLTGSQAMTLLGVCRPGMLTFIKS